MIWKIEPISNTAIPVITPSSRGWDGIEAEFREWHATWVGKPNPDMESIACTVGEEELRIRALQWEMSEYEKQHGVERLFPP